MWGDEGYRFVHRILLLNAILPFPLFISALLFVSLDVEFAYRQVRGREAGRQAG